MWINLVFAKTPYICHVNSQGVFVCNFFLLILLAKLGYIPNGKSYFFPNICLEIPNSEDKIKCCHTKVLKKLGELLYESE